MKRVFAILLMSIASVAFASDGARHIDFTQPLTAIDGKPMSEGSDNAKRTLTLGDVAVTSLEGQLEEDRALPGIEKFKHDELARKIYGQKDVVLTVEEITLIKDRIGKIFSAAVVGAAWRLLDPAMYQK